MNLSTTEADGSRTPSPHQSQAPIGDSPSNSAEESLKGVPLASPGSALQVASASRLNSERGNKGGKKRASPTEGTDEKQDVGEQRRMPCKARRAPEDHRPDTAYFVIPPNAEHGMHLTCSHPRCGRGKFRYCKFCDIPVAKRNFPRRHAHGIPEFTARCIDSSQSKAALNEREESDESDGSISGGVPAHAGVAAAAAAATAVASAAPLPSAAEAHNSTVRSVKRRPSDGSGMVRTLADGMSGMSTSTPTAMVEDLAPRPSSSGGFDLPIPDGQKSFCQLAAPMCPAPRRATSDTAVVTAANPAPVPQHVSHQSESFLFHNYSTGSLEEALPTEQPDSSEQQGVQLSADDLWNQVAQNIADANASQEVPSADFMSSDLDMDIMDSTIFDDHLSSMSSVTQTLLASTPNLPTSVEQEPTSAGHSTAPSTSIPANGNGELPPSCFEPPMGMHGQGSTASNHDSSDNVEHPEITTEQRNWLDLLNNRPHRGDARRMRGWLEGVIRVSEAFAPPASGPEEHSATQDQGVLSSAGGGGAEIEAPPHHGVHAAPEMYPDQPSGVPVMTETRPEVVAGSFPALPHHPFAGNVPPENVGSADHNHSQHHLAFGGGGVNQQGGHPSWA